MIQQGIIKAGIVSLGLVVNTLVNSALASIGGILTEEGGFILTEEGGVILLENGYSTIPSFTFSNPNNLIQLHTGGFL